MFWVEVPSKCRAFFLLLLLLAINCSSLRAEQLPVKTYTTAEGLARDQVNCIVQDTHGFLWFCTGEGLSRFDGYKFSNYTTAQGLSNNMVNDLLETHDGAYLVATTKGLSVLDPHGSPPFSNWRAAEQGAEAINVLIEDSKGRIWCGTNVGLYQIEKSSNGWQFHYIDLGLPRMNFDSWLVESLVADNSDSLWIGTRGSGLVRYWTNGRMDHFTEKNGLPSNRVTALIQDHTGSLWVGTNSGLCRLVSDPKSDRRVVADIFTVDDGLSDNWIAALFESTEGKLFAGSYPSAFLSTLAARSAAPRSRISGVRGE